MLRGFGPARSSHDGRKAICGIDAEDFEACTSGRVHPARSSDGAHRHRGLEATHKVSFVVDFPLGHGGITPVLTAAQAWQPASMARQSWPQAMATALMAFMTPLLAWLLCTGRGGEMVGLDDAGNDLCALCGVAVVRHGLGAKAASIRAMRSVARLTGCGAGHVHR